MSDAMEKAIKLPAMTGPHSCNKHLREKLPTVKQHGLDAGRDPNPHHFPDNGEIEWPEKAPEGNAQCRVKTRHQHPNNGERTDIAGDCQPKTCADKPQPIPRETP
jgi:hypothetical protein